MKHHFSSYTLSSWSLFVALLIVIASVLFTNHLARQLQNEELHRVQLWAQATQRLIEADEGADLQMEFSIIEANTTIPVYMVDADGQIVDTRNVTRPVDDPSSLNGPILLSIEDAGQLITYSIYYDESVLLRRLRWFPYVEFGIILLFVIIAVVALYVAQRSEQNRVWAGLSKETAHQLGTPISSLMAWQELLKMRYPDDEMIPQMRQDINRLHVIADRFSKVGSEPELAPCDLCRALRESVAYMRSRISDKVTINLSDPEEIAPLVALNLPLFSWVVENLIKNAVDAMNGVGTVTISVSSVENKVYVDVADTGKGIERNKFRTVFQPGYTDKQRGWGLGLSLSKRIVEDYHGGQLFVYQSKLGVGTTFRMILEETEQS